MSMNEQILGLKNFGYNTKMFHSERTTIYFQNILLNLHQSMEQEIIYSLFRIT